MSIKLIPQPDGTLSAELTTPCGKVINPAALVFEPTSTNPGLQLMNPLGFNAVLDIINQTHQWANRRSN
jgi:hypothetical protein